MPCAADNLYHAASGAVLPRWDNIKDVLEQSISSTFELEVHFPVSAACGFVLSLSLGYGFFTNRLFYCLFNFLMQETILTYNPRFAKSWSFDDIHNAFAQVLAILFRHCTQNAALGCDCTA
jgi:hypothetical protein